MTRYIIRRLLFFFPSVAVITVFTFVLIRSLPGNEVLLLQDNNSENNISPFSAADITKKRRSLAEKLGTDVPVFYMEINRLSMPAEAAYEWNLVKKKTLYRWTLQTGNYKACRRWYEFLEQSSALLNYAGDSEKIQRAETLLFELSQTADETETRQAFARLSQTLLSDTLLQKRAGWLSQGSEALEDRFTKNARWKNNLPAIRLYSECAFGHWFFGRGKNGGVIRGDFGNSLADGKPIRVSLSEKIGLTVLMSLASLLLTYLISIPLGTWLALYRGHTAEKIINGLLFLGFSLPSFWVASLCIVMLAGGDGLNWFAPYGSGGLSLSMPPGEFFHTLIRHFTLPIFAWTYGGIAFVTQQTKTALGDASDNLYFRAALAHGIPLRSVIWKHLWPNSLRPLITLGANILPGLIGGSVVLETLFSLPGMGEWLYRAYFLRDFPVILAILFWSSLLTLTGYLISDLLLIFTDPKIRQNEWKK
jgi:peptide/nickel transport system permease protein